jgi:SAM-dependent methyltransferase
MLEKNIEWLKGDDKELQYHTKQFDNPKEHTKKVSELLNEWGLIYPNIKILDLGCGTGANDYYFAKEYPKAYFHGIDINNKYIEIANLKKLSNTSFSCGDLLNLNMKPSLFSGILCLQTISRMDYFKKPMQSMFDLNPDWIIITSLFYDGPVDAEIKITDYSRTMGNENYRKSSYNIYSLDNIKLLADQNNYNLRIAKEFIFPFELKQPDNQEMGTYTKKLFDGKLIQISGPLLMPWYTLLFEKIV